MFTKNINHLFVCFTLQLIMNSIEFIENILNLDATSCLSVSFSYFFYRIFNK